jgi:hypothetical protein
VDEVDTEFLRYLSSLKELETLRITASENRQQTWPDDLAYQFFNTVLPRLAHSLKELFILVPQSKWCYFPEYSSSLLRCEKLDRLSLSIAFSRRVDASVGISHAVGVKDIDVNIAQCLMDLFI